MKLGVKSISGKIFYLYMTLALINIAFFSIIIFENQIELIVDNTIYQYKELAGGVAETLQFSAYDINTKNNTISDSKLNNAVSIISRTIDNFLIISEDGKILAQKGENEAISERDVADSVKAITARDFSGTLYFTRVERSRSDITFYIPVKTGGVTDQVLIFRRSLYAMNDQLKAFYRQIGVVVFFLALFHIAVAFLFYRIFVKPLSNLHKQSSALSSGNYSARVEQISRDEIGELSLSFNSMADSIQEKVRTLEEYNSRMDFELSLAGDVQKLIYPEIKDNERFNLSLFSKPCGSVNGDYYDIFDLGENRFAFLIADVSGHGVPAALLTMTLKEKFNLYASAIDDPAEIFKILNTEILQMLTSEMTIPHYFTGFYIVIENDNSVSFCSAGHPLPVYISKRNKCHSFLRSDGGVVGLMREMGESYTTEKVQMEPGDKIILLTDGILEAADHGNVQFGVDRILQVINEGINLPVKDNVAMIVQRLKEFTNIDKLIDDATILGIEIK